MKRLFVYISFPMSLIIAMFFAINSIEIISYVKALFYDWLYYFISCIVIGVSSGFIFSFMFLYLAKYEEYFARKNGRSKRWSEKQRKNLSNWLKEQEKIPIENKTDEQLLEDEYKHYELSNKVYEKPYFDIFLFVEGVFLRFYALCFLCVSLWLLVLPGGSENLLEGLYNIYSKTEEYKDIYLYSFIGVIIGLVKYFRKYIKTL